MEGRNKGIAPVKVRYKEVEGWPDYRVGDDGSAWSRKGPRGRPAEWHTLKGHQDEDGYFILCMTQTRSIDGRRISLSKPIAHLILEAFVGPRPHRGMAARHRDGDQSNLSLSNLFWGTYPRWANLQRGADNPSWKGNRVKKDSGRERARKLYTLGPCEHCGKPATDRHHKDDNPLNNDPGNVEMLCRRCHMLADGRMEAFVKAEGARKHGSAPPKPCCNCGRLWKPLRKGRCGACSDYFRANNRERTVEAVSWWHLSHGTAWNQ
jgi:hypothetical protein